MKKEHLSFAYGSSVIALPAAACDAVAGASLSDVCVLFELARTPALLEDITANAAALAQGLSLSKQQVLSAIAFWRGAGVLTEAGAAEKSDQTTGTLPAASKSAARALPDRGLPTYSAAELADIAEGNKDFGALIGACQQTFGKIFNTAEVSIIAGLTDYLGLEGDYILLLLSHCVRMEKKSLRYAEKTALSLYDDGVTDATALEERLQRIEMMADATGKIRAMFGMSSRSFTTKEKTMIEKWICVMKYGMDVLKLAYDSTVDAIGKPSVSYTNTILERWYAEGYRTVEDVSRAMEAYRRQKMGGSSFDADDFFKAALKNTYGEL